MRTFFFDTLWVCWRELKHFSREKMRITVTLVQPIVWLTLMGNVYQKITAIPGFPAASYIDFMSPGIIIMVTLFGGIFGGTSIVWDRRLGFLHKMMAAPIARSAIIAGKMLAIGIQTSLQVLIIFIVALLMGVKFTAGFLGLLVLLPLAALLCLFFAGISLSAGSVAPSHETVMAMMSFLTMPLMFTSNAMMPLDLMPDWLAEIARVNPLTYAIDPIRALFLTGWDWPAIGKGVVLLGMLVILATFMATYLFRRSQI